MQMATDNSGFSAKLSDAQSTVSQLTADLYALDKKLTTSCEREANLSKENGALITTIAETEAELDASVNELSEIQAETQVTKSNAAEQQVRFDENTCKLVETQAQLCSALSRQSELNAEKNDLDKLRAGEVKQTKALQDQAKCLQKTSANERLKLEGKLAGAAAKIDTLKAHTAELKLNVKTLESALKDEQAKVRETEGKLEDALSTQTLEAFRHIKAQYIHESTLRKQLHNQIREMQGNIRVFCRVRPDLRTEQSIMTFPDAEFAETPVQIACPCPGFPNAQKRFEFDRVFLPTATQEIVFEETKPLITSCADGYNVAIITYGQTGAGKTHTLMGSKACPGLNPRAMDELLRVCQERTQIDYALNVSLIEIYCNTLVDLLSDEPVEDQKCAVQGGKLHGLVTHTITSAAEIAGVLEKGSRNRQVAATAMNSESSRSHMMLCLEVSSTDRITGHKSTGKLTLVDLAGSERLDKTFDATVGDALPSALP